MRRIQLQREQAHHVSFITRLKPTRFLWITIVILLVLQVWVSNRLASSGSKMVKVEEDIESVSHENSQLTEKIASASALLTIKTKAAQLGFERTAKPVFLHPKQPVALDLPKNGLR